MSLFGRVKRKVKEKAMGAILAKVVKAVAEGRLGPGPAKAYWWLAGKKTWISLILFGVYGVLNLAAQLQVCEPCGGWAASLPGVAGLLLMVGLFDGAVRLEPPQKPPSVR